MRWSLRLIVPVTMILSLHSLNAGASPILLTFDNIGRSANLRHFYEGGPGVNGPGPNYGIEFLSGRITTPCFFPNLGPAACLPDPPAFEPFGENQCPFPTPVDCSTMNVQAGFTDGMHFQYMSPVQPTVVAIFDDLNGQGNLLALAFTAITTDLFSNFGPGYQEMGIAFTGTAHSVQFVQNDWTPGGDGAFDNIVLGSVDAIPEPTTLTLLGTGLLMLRASRRNR